MSKKRSAAELERIGRLQAQRAGYEQWRRGPAPKAKPAPIHQGEARKHVILKVMDVLRDWRMSPFENEASCRAGLRSALCLKGYGWERADREAASIVADGLRLLGAHRPTWEQGQREYSIPRENCSWCGVDMPDDLLHGRFNVRFCSDVCAKSAIQHRDFGSKRHDTEMFRSAWDIIQRTKNPSRPCRHCGVMFRPTFDVGHGLNTGEFCSQKCNGASKRYVPKRNCEQCGETFQPRHMGVKLCSRACASLYHRRDIPLRDCLHCGEAFRPKSVSVDPKFCCMECRHAHGGIRKYERDCEWCGTAFSASLPYARSCSKTCATHLSNARAGKFPKRLNPPVFDYVFAMAA